MLLQVLPSLNDSMILRFFVPCFPWCFVSCSPPPCSHPFANRGQGPQQIVDIPCVFRSDIGAAHVFEESFGAL